MYQINNLNVSSAQQPAYQAQSQAAFLSRILSQRLSLLLILMGVIFPSMEVFAGYTTPTGNSSNSSVGVGNAVYQTCTCDDPDGLPASAIECNKGYTVLPLKFDLKNNTTGVLTLQNIYSNITAPNGQQITPTNEEYKKWDQYSFGIYSFQSQTDLVLPITVLPGGKLVIESYIDFVFCTNSPLFPTGVLPGDYTITTYMTGILQNGTPFTTTVSYSFHLTSFGGGLPPGLKTTPIVDEAISGLTWAPNPSSKLARLSFNLNEVGPVEIEILNLQGQIVEHRFLEGEMPVGKQSVKWNVSHLAPGIYFARVRTKNEEQYVKWIKQ